MKRNHLQSIITTVMEQGFTVLGKREWIHWVDQLVKLIWYHCLKNGFILNLLNVLEILFNIIPHQPALFKTTAQLSYCYWS